MVIDAGCFCGCFKIFSRYGKSVPGTDIAGDKKIIYLFTICLCLHLIHSLDIIKYRFWIFQIYISLYIRKILPDIKVQSHAGAYAVTIRTDMSCNTHSPDTVQYL